MTSQVLVQMRSLRFYWFLSTQQPPSRSMNKRLCFLVGSNSILDPTLIGPTCNVVSKAGCVVIALLPTSRQLDCVFSVFAFFYEVSSTPCHYFLSHKIKIKKLCFILVIDFYYDEKCIVNTIIIQYQPDLILCSKKSIECSNLP